MSFASAKIIDKNARVSHGRFAPVNVRFAFDESDAERVKLARDIAGQISVSKITSQILVSRGLISPQAAKSFLAPTLKTDLPDPALIKNIDAAAALILETVAAGEKITVYTDFDVDGLTAGSQLAIFLQALGANVHLYVPNRFVEGYGLALSAVEKIAANGTKLLVTVDCGITNNKEIAAARKAGVKTIVVDHHQPAELPPADIVVDPAQPGCPFQEYKLAAAGLVWMLLIVLRNKAKTSFAEQIAGGKVILPEVKDFLDLAAVGTICDMVPLTGLNRLIAHRGIEALRISSRVGLVALKEVAGLVGAPRFGAGHVAFGIGPRINAAGRLEDAAQVATLLTTKDSVKAKALAESIDRLNERRKAIEDEVRTRCLELITASDDLLSAPAIALYDPEFHTGVIGIAAQRLVEEFHKPAAVMGPGESIVGGQPVKVIKGSVRSITGFNVAEVLHELRELLIAGGGHAQAGGFTVACDRLEVFQAAFIDAGRKLLSADHLLRVQRADVKVRLAEVDFVLVDELSKLAPFGVGNPAPVLVTERVDVESAVALSGKHVRLRLSDGTCGRNAVGWGLLGHPLLRKGSRVSVAYQPEINSYQGISSVQLNLKAVWEA